MAKDYYSVLGVSKSASDAEIKSAYRKLAREWHPDVAKDKPNAEEKFKELNEAYQILGDKDKKAHYDQFGTAPGDQSGFQGGNPFGGGFGGGPFQWSYSSGQGFDGAGIDPFDIFEEVFGFRGFGGARKGRNVRYSMAISFEDSIRGFEDTISADGHKLKVKLPPGVMDGATVTFKGKGEPARSKEGQPGDLLLSINILPHKEFHREGLDIFSTQTISLKTAILGGKINIKTVDPKSKSAFSEKDLKIPNGTQPDTVFRLKGYGVPNPKGFGRGDHYVTIKIEIPKSVSREQKDLLEKHFK